METENHASNMISKSKIKAFVYILYSVKNECCSYIFCRQGSLAVIRCIRLVRWYFHPMRIIACYWKFASSRFNEVGEWICTLLETKALISPDNNGLGVILTLQGLLPLRMKLRNSLKVFYIDIFFPDEFRRPLSFINKEQDSSRRLEDLTGFIRWFRQYLTGLKQTAKKTDNTSRVLNK